MSAIEYRGLLFEVSQRFDELNMLKKLLFLCKKKLTPGGNIENALALFERLEEQKYLGTDRLKLLKELLEEVGEWSLLEKVKTFENKRKEYKALLKKARCALDELNDLERLIKICEGKISEEREGNIKDVQSLLQGLEDEEILGISCLDILKDLLTATERGDLLQEVEKFEERRNREAKFKRQKGELEAAFLIVMAACTHSIQSITLVCNFRTVAGGLLTVNSGMALQKCSTRQDYQETFEKVVLPSSNKLIEISNGSIRFTVESENLIALKELWEIYKDGTLQSRLQEFLVTDEIKQLANGEDIEVTVFIDEHEYNEAFFNLFLLHQGSERRESKQTMKFMGAEKMDFVQRYIENVQETYSLTTEASDSGLGARTAVSEEETEDVRDSSTICVKDLGEESINEVDRKLSVDKVGLDRVFRFFGLKVDFRPSSHVSCMRQIAHNFPNTPADLMRQCFEALQMYDLVDLLEKAVKTISLRPVLSSGEVETLRTGNLPTKSHNNVVVLVVNESADKDLNQKIEGFFKELNSQNDVTVIGSSRSEEKLKELRDLKRKQMDLKRKQMVLKQPSGEVGKTKSAVIRRVDRFSAIKFQITQLEKEIEMNKPLVEELLKENEETKTIITSTMDNWIQNQEKFTAIFLAFIIDEKQSIYDYDVLSECVASKLSSLPYHTKTVVGAPRG
ncbi:unnamed protein product [Pocillopora meandrina]|uniref:DED domain-containing protein n=1 Tax=Pocillopora meandrina TaxID=46732 RepID=A0AAU9XHY3_9CNID|nr:unnamed protein product [Pocillopora meandrina]